MSTTTASILSAFIASYSTSDTISAAAETITNYINASPSCDLYYAFTGAVDSTVSTTGTVSLIGEAFAATGMSFLVVINSCNSEVLVSEGVLTSTTVTGATHTLVGAGSYMSGSSTVTTNTTSSHTLKTKSALICPAGSIVVVIGVVPMSSTLNITVGDPDTSTYTVLIGGIT